mmetsp:Transcript_1083/g.2321  ORF Transcript_1083/g.2321 Transcript_1083/m.2321 type:complete len:159 (+) Transcript_1083:538-1014(+)
MTATASGFSRTGSNFETAVSTTPASMGVAHAFSTSSLKGAAPVVASSAGPRPHPAAASSSFAFAQEDEIESQTGSAAGREGIRNHNKNDPPPPQLFYPESQMEVDPQARPTAAAAADHPRTEEEDVNRPTAKKPPSPFLLKLQEERLKRHTLMKQRGF